MLNNNVNLPKHIYAKLRTEFRNNQKPGTEGFVDCVVFGAESLPNQTLGFHILTDEGMLYSQVPIHGLCWLEDAPNRSLQELSNWDCFGLTLTVIEYEYLTGCELEYQTERGEILKGRYICTFDFVDNGYSNYPEQHKHFHFVALDEGNFCLAPNNRLRVWSKSFTDNLFDWDQIPQVEANKCYWYTERRD